MELQIIALLWWQQGEGNGADTGLHGFGLKAVGLIGAGGRTFVGANPQVLLALDEHGGLDQNSVGYTLTYRLISRRA